MTIHPARSGDVGGTPFKDYHLALDMAKELAMVENNVFDRCTGDLCEFIDASERDQVLRVERQRCHAPTAQEFYSCRMEA